MLLLYPPVAFLLILVFLIGLNVLLSRLAFKPRSGNNAGFRTAYACGEDIAEHKVQVNYGEFFPFAFFFTILHVVALMVATVSVVTLDSFVIAVIYMLGAMTGLVVLFRPR